MRFEIRAASRSRGVREVGFLEKRSVVIPVNLNDGFPSARSMLSRQSSFADGDGFFLERDSFYLAISSGEGDGLFGKLPSVVKVIWKIYEEKCAKCRGYELLRRY